MYQGVSQWKNHHAQPSHPPNYVRRCFGTVDGKRRSLLSDYDTTSLPHDVGGRQSKYGPIPKQPGDLQAWELQCHSLFAVLASKTILSTDQLRYSIESLAPNQYNLWGYYEKWSAAMAKLLLESDVLSEVEFMEALFGSDTLMASSSQGDPLYKPGDPVRVKPYQCNIEWRRPHLRTPGYLYGACGSIEQVGECYGDPSLLAFGFKAPMVRLYRVRFRQQDIWPEQSQRNQHDVIIADIYEHWMERSEESSGHAYSNLADRLFNHNSGADCDHSHHHGHGHHTHVHEPRPLVEQRAIEREGSPRPGQQLHRVLYKLLVQKGIVSADEIRLMSERLETAGQRLQGASLVARAWSDPAFEERLLADAPAAAAELGIATANPNAPTMLTVVKNTATLHNLVVCTLCSCYPSGLLGIAPSWYKSTEFRSRAVREPRSVLREFGLTHIHDNMVEVHVHDSTADHRYLVLPEQPQGTEHYTEEQLRSIVTRDSMLGVSVPRSESTS